MASSLAAAKVDVSGCVLKVRAFRAQGPVFRQASWAKLESDVLGPVLSRRISKLPAKPAKPAQPAKPPKRQRIARPGLRLNLEPWHEATCFEARKSMFARSSSMPVLKTTALPGVGWWMHRQLRGFAHGSTVQVGILVHGIMLEYCLLAPSMRWCPGSASCRPCPWLWRPGAGSRAGRSFVWLRHVWGLRQRSRAAMLGPPRLQTSNLFLASHIAEPLCRGVGAMERRSLAHSMRQLLVEAW